MRQRFLRVADYTAEWSPEPMGAFHVPNAGQISQNQTYGQGRPWCITSGLPAIRQHRSKRLSGVGGTS